MKQPLGYIKIHLTASNNCTEIITLHSLQNTSDIPQLLTFECHMGWYFEFKIWFDICFFSFFFFFFLGGGVITLLYVILYFNGLCCNNNCAAQSRWRHNSSGFHLGDVSWCLKSLATWLFLQQFVQTNNKEYIKAPYYCPFVGVIHWSPVYSNHKGPIFQSSHYHVWQYKFT